MRRLSHTPLETVGGGHRTLRPGARSARGYISDTAPTTHAMKPPIGVHSRRALRIPLGVAGYVQNADFPPHGAHKGAFAPADHAGVCRSPISRIRRSLGASNSMSMSASWCRARPLRSSIGENAFPPWVKAGRRATDNGYRNGLRRDRFGERARFPRARVDAHDISAAALSVCRRNVRRLGWPSESGCCSRIISPPWRVAVTISS